MDATWPVDLLHVLTLLVVKEVDIDSVAVVTAIEVLAPHRFQQQLE